MSFFFFFNDTATTEIYTLSLHDALPIFIRPRSHRAPRHPRRRHSHHCRRRAHRALLVAPAGRGGGGRRSRQDRKSTRLNSSHSQISYAVFCLKKKKTITTSTTPCSSTID